MALVPDAAQAGLWTNPDLKPGKAGVFALIIGVSRYDHLAGGAHPAKETYGLGQLGVSALTAYRFFEWLCNGYVLTGWPVAKVRLLLSPLKKGIGDATEDELAGCDPRICTNALEANFLNCKRAIANWYADLQAIPPDADGRSLFFFTGHGLELRRSRQVLLPSDYLYPPIPSFDDSISTRNLIDYLPTLPRVSSHVLLLDACRNDLKELRKIEGAQIFSEQASDVINADSVTGVLHSTEAGRQAYQPKSKSDGISLFGQALLDGLKTIPNPALDEAPIKLNCQSGVCKVEINSLTSYIKGRMDALIRSAKEGIVQTVRVDVSSPDPDKRQIDLNEIRDLHTDPRLPEHPTDGNFVDNSLVGLAVGVGRRSGILPKFREFRLPPREVSVEERAAWLGRRYSDHEISVPELPPNAPPGDQVYRLHHFFGSEAVTFPWLQSLGVVGLATGEKSDQSAVEIISTRLGDPTPSLHRVQVQLRVVPTDMVGHLLTIKDECGQELGCILPSDTRPSEMGPEHFNPIYQLEIDVGRSDTGSTYFIRFAASLSPQNHEGKLRVAAKVWERLRALDPTAASQLIGESAATSEIAAVSGEMNRIWAHTGQPEDYYRESERTLADKVESPLAAAIAGLVLLKANRFDLMHDWTRNVGNWFPWLPDGIVLWTEQQRRMARGKALDRDLITWFVANLSSRGLPFTSDCLGLAADILDDVVRGRIATDAATLEDATALKTRFDGAMDSFRDDALFCTYADWDDVLRLQDIVSPPKIMDEKPSEEFIDARPMDPTEVFFAEPLKPKTTDPDEDSASAGA